MPDEWPVPYVRLRTDAPEWCEARCQHCGAEQHVFQPDTPLAVVALGLFVERHRQCEAAT